MVESTERMWPADESFRAAVEEILTHVEEEAAEVIQACTKLRRFGPEGTDPRREGGPTNAEALAFEIGQLSTAVRALEGLSPALVPVRRHEAGRASKLVKLQRYLECSTVAELSDGRISTCPK